MEPMLLGSPTANSTSSAVSSPFLPAYLMGDSFHGTISKVKPSSPTKMPKHVSFGANSTVSPAKFPSTPADSRSYRTSVSVEKASGPPIKCLYDTLDESYASPATVKSPERNYHEINSSILSGSSFQDKSMPPANKEENWVTVFGFPPSSASFIASLFGNCGLIVDKRVPPKGNWLHLRFQSAHEVHKALSYNGKIFSGSIMLGVTICQDPEILQDSQVKENILETSYSTRNTPVMVCSPGLPQSVLNQSTDSNFSYLGSPVRIGNARPLGQTYRPGQNDETLNQGNTPQKSTSMVTKAMEYVFGW